MYIIMHIDLKSLGSCSGCFVGKRNLEAAIREAPPGLSVTVKWLPFLLRHDIPEDGMTFEAYMRGR